MSKSTIKNSINERWIIKTAVTVIRDVRKSKVVTQDSERERRIRIGKVVESALVDLEKENDY
mgnify:CR=1 FL=1